MRPAIIGSNNFWSNNPKDCDDYLTTFDLTKVTKIEIYYGTNEGINYVACIVFYKEQNILEVAGCS